MSIKAHHRITGRILAALGLAFLLARFSAGAAGLEVAFDAANKLAEEGKHAEAAAAYDKLLAEGNRTASIYYNLGVASFKAGQMGRAVVAFRRAEALTPRDSNLRANLQFVRKKVNGEGKSPLPAWQNWFTLLTLNEGTVLAAGTFWVWFLLLAIQEYKPSLKRSLHGATLGAAFLTLIFVSCLALSAYARFGNRWAVVTIKEAVARFGPLDEAQTAFLLPDGSEVVVLDSKDNWLQVRDAERRIAWVKRQQLVLVSDPGTEAKTTPPTPPIPPK